MLARNTLYLILFSTALSACSSDADQKQIEKHQDKKPLPEFVEPVFKVPPRTLPKLNANNYKKLLLEYGKKHENKVITIENRFGIIKIRFYDETPLHRSNFIMLSNEGYYDMALFTRIAKNFIVQGGGSDEEEAEWKRNMIGIYGLEAEMKPELYHKRGAVAMARAYDNNPTKLSSSYDFYIVQGVKHSNAMLNALEKETGYKIPEKHREIYRTLGGAPHLDQEHTVFGEVISGMDVIDKMAEVKVDSKEWPYTNIGMTITVK